MITIPLKETEKIEWADQIRPELISLYGNSSGFEKEIEALDEIRDAVVTAHPNIHGRDLLFKYFAQLNRLTLHLPMKPFRIEFTWKNAFDKKKTTLKSLDFEKVCVLFNLGATLSHLADEAVMSKDYKSAYHMLSCAAGIFKFGSEEFPNVPCVDLEPNTLTAISKLMHAQAQECFFLKAKESTTAASLLPKLAMGAASLYTESENLIRALYDKHWWCNISMIEEINEASRDNIIEAHLLQPEQLEKYHKVGDAIAHLNEAKKLLSDKETIASVKAKIETLEKENNMIYHESVPSVPPEIPSKVVAKPLAIESLYPSKEETAKIVGKDIFERIIPLAVHEKASLYSEVKAQFLRKQIEKCEVSNLELISSLEYMDLPAAISRLKQNPEELAEIPPDIIEYSLSLSPSGNLSGKYEIKSDFKAEREHVLSLLKIQQGSSDIGVIEAIQRVKQQLLNVSKLEAELTRIKEQLKSNDDILALTSPKLLESRYKEEAIKARAASKTTDATSTISLLDLNDTIPGEDSSFNDQLECISDLVSKLQKIMKERTSCIDDLRDKVHKDDITEKINLNSDNLNDIKKTLFEPELEKFSGTTRRIDATVRLQKAVLNDIVERWKHVLDTQDAKNVINEREAILEAINELSSRLREVYQQWTVAAELSNQIQDKYSQLVRDSLNVNSSVPSTGRPKRPPPIPSKAPRDDSSYPRMSGYSTPSAYDPSMYN